MPLKVVGAYLSEAVHNLEEASFQMTRLEGKREYDPEVAAQIEQALKIALKACEAMED